MTHTIDGPTRQGWCLATPGIILTTALLALPLAFVATYSLWITPPVGPDIPSFDFGNWRRALVDAFYWQALARTLTNAAVVTLLCAALGYPPAYLLARLQGRKRALLTALIMLPFWISYVIRTMSWLPVLGASGLVNRILLWSGTVDAPVKFLFNRGAVVLGLVHYLLPFMIITIFTSLDAIDKALVPAARTLGCRPIEAFQHITFPLSISGLAAGSMLCFVLAAGSFVTAEILGGPRDYLFSALIYDQIIHRVNWPFGSVLSILLLAILGLLLAAYYRLVGGQRLLRAWL